MSNPFENKDDFAADFQQPLLDETWEPGEKPLDLRTERPKQFSWATGDVYVIDSTGAEYKIGTIKEMEQLGARVIEGIDEPLPVPRDKPEWGTVTLGVLASNIGRFRALTNCGSVVVKLGSSMGKSEDLMRAFQLEIERLQRMHYVSLDATREQQRELEALLKQAMSECQPLRMRDFQQFRPPFMGPDGKPRKGKGEKRRNRKDRWRGKGGAH